MSSSNEHIVDIGDDPKGVECRCLASGCHWRFKSEDRNERLHEAYKHVADAVNGPIT